MGLYCNMPCFETADSRVVSSYPFVCLYFQGYLSAATDNFLTIYLVFGYFAPYTRTVVYTAPSY